jgi:hypothetical protein
MKINIVIERGEPDLLTRVSGGLVILVTAVCAEARCGSADAGASAESKPVLYVLLLGQV